MPFRRTPNSSAVAVGAKEVQVFSREPLKLRVTLAGHHGTIRSIAFFPGGNRLLSVAEDRSIRIWDTSSGQEVLKRARFGDFYACASLSPDGSCCAVGSSNELLFLSPGDLEVVAAARTGHTFSENWTLALCFSPDGKRLATAHQDGTARLWSTASRRPDAVLSGHRDRVRSVAFSHDGDRKSVV